jgi:hypothetical protein
MDALSAATLLPPMSLGKPNASALFFFESA